MKRKLNANDAPAPVAVAAASQSEPQPPAPNAASAPPQSAPAAAAAAASSAKSPSSDPSFADLGLDSRLLQAIARQNYLKPTLVQAKAIPLAIDGADLLAKAKTGSGKTAAYALPLLHALLRRKQSSAAAPASSSGPSALVLVPTRELADQVSAVFDSLAAFCQKDAHILKLSDKLSDNVQRSLLSASPDVVVATPARAWHNVKSGALSLASLSQLVLDEADLVLSYGYDDDLKSVAAALPKGIQTILMSATLTPEVDSLKGLLCRNPTILDLAEPEAEGEGVSQYIVKCAEDEKFLLMYVMLKLQLVKGKCIVFVADVDRCYRLKLFFEQFGIRSCILNSELPVNSRIHVVQEFNRGVYDIIIASDENEVLGDEDQEAEAETETATTTNNGGDDGGASTDKTKQKDNKGKKGKDADGGDGAAPPKKKRKASSRRDKEYGVSRGIDFVNVACVINFDLPATAKSYTHRIGRTARAGQTGFALSFAVPSEQFGRHRPTSIAQCEADERTLARIERQQARRGKELRPYHFDMAQVGAFRYRMNDALRAVTQVAVREARTRELRQELLRSDALRRHWEENPAELHHLRHDGELRTSRVQPHLRHVPEYLLPAEGKKALTPGDVGFVPFHKPRDGKGRRGRSFKAGGRGGRRGGGGGGGIRKSDPLKSFKSRSKPKK